MTETVKEDIICISSIDWDFIWQGHQEICSTLARQGNRVLFIENTGVRSPGIRDMGRLRSRIRNYLRGTKGIRKEAPNLYVYSPLALPFPYSRLARMINRRLMLSMIRRWMDAIGFQRPVIWTFLPTGTALDLIHSLEPKLLIYYCIDNFTASSAAAARIRSSERALIREADLVFTTSHALYEYCARDSSRVHLFPFGVNISRFEAVRDDPNAPVPPDIAALRPPIVGYVGGIHKWIDFPLLEHAARALPDVTFALVGPLQADPGTLRGLPNVHFLGNKQHTELPHYIKRFSAAVIPYRLSEYTRNVYPTKLNEYLSLGTPVVSTALPEIEAFARKHPGTVELADSPESFSQRLKETLRKKEDAPQRSARIAAARLNSWEARIAEMSALIGEALEKKRIQQEAHWTENILAFSRAASRKISSIILLTGLAYGALFYTPLLWTLARPLLVVEKPLKSDAIVVFAGGVGESGKWGQGYEERVQYAVELYRQGFAPKLLFSSGYSYAFKEPQIMKALAVSLGVPTTDILLEENAIRTYENALYSSALCRAHGWHSILLVTSPYHTRRACLVFRKIAPQLYVRYTPIPQSLFYTPPARNAGGGILKRWATPDQVSGILHEYIGIVYYWIKGWI